MFKLGVCFTQVPAGQGVIEAQVRHLKAIQGMPGNTDWTALEMSQQSHQPRLVASGGTLARRASFVTRAPPLAF